MFKAVHLPLTFVCFAWQFSCNKFVQKSVSGKGNSHGLPISLTTYA